MSAFNHSQISEANSKKKKRQGGGLLIDHESIWCKIWVLLMFFYSIVTSFLYAILAAYRDPVNPYLQSLELVYIIDMATKFLTTFIDTKSKNKITDSDVIVTHYKENGFYRDLLALIPLQMIPIDNGINNLFYLIKIVRIFKAIENLNITTVVQTFKYYKDKYVTYESKQRLEKEIRKRRQR